MIGTRIKEVLKEAKQTQSSAAALLGVGYSTLKTYLLNKRLPNSMLLEMICRVYKVKPRWLLLGEGEMFEFEKIKYDRLRKESIERAVAKVRKQN